MTKVALTKVALTEIASTEVATNVIALHEAALHGSSHYDLPPILRWFTANIGIHHVHHLYSRIPFYRLTEVLRDHNELVEVSRMTIAQSIKCASLDLWDEKSKRLISFAAARKMAA